MISDSQVISQIHGLELPNKIPNFLDYMVNPNIMSRLFRMKSSSAIVSAAIDVNLLSRELALAQQSVAVSKSDACKLLKR